MSLYKRLDHPTYGMTLSQTTEIKSPVRSLQSSQFEQAQVLTKIAAEITAIKDQARGHEQVLALQQDLVGRLVSVMQKRSKGDPGTMEHRVEQNDLPPSTPPDPWFHGLRGDAG